MARVKAIGWAAALAIASPAASAQNARPVLAIDGSLSATDNGGQSAPGFERPERIVSVRPSIAFKRRSPGLEFDLDAAATFLSYANGTQADAVLPDAGASLKATLVERLLYVDAAARVRQSEVDPFGVRAGDAASANRRTEGSYRLSPTLASEVAAHTSLLARHDAMLTTNAAGPGVQFVSHRSLLRLERQPVPLGLAVEWGRLENESSGVADSRFSLDTARLRGSVDVGQDVVLGAVAGRDRSRWMDNDLGDALYGLGLSWNPGPRTSLSANLEHRFFGRGGGLTFRHRMPFMAFVLTMSREPVMSSASLAVLGQGSDLRSFLDAILTTRHTDPETRGALVDSLIAGRGLDLNAPTPIDVIAAYPQIQTSLNANWVVLGSRNTFSLSLYSRTVRRLAREIDLPLLSADALADSRQTGGSLQFNRQLAPQLSIDALVQWSRINGLAARDGDTSDEKIQRLSLIRQVSPRTGVSAGAQHNEFSTTVVGQHPYDATLLFVGMSHRF